jgi:hypothetical protein
MLIQRVWIAAAICLICLSHLSAAHAQSIDQDEIEELILEEAPSEPREVHVGVQVHQIKFVDQKAENFGVVGTLRLEWEDPKLAFDASETGRDFKVYTKDAFRRFTSKNALFHPGFIIQNQQERRFKQKAHFVIFSGGQVLYIERFSTVLQAPDFNFTQFPFDTQKFFVRVVSDYPAEYVKYVALEEFSELGKKLGEEEWLLSAPRLLHREDLHTPGDFRACLLGHILSRGIQKADRHCGSQSADIRCVQLRNLGRSATSRLHDLLGFHSCCHVYHHGPDHCLQRRA